MKNVYPAQEPISVTDAQARIAAEISVMGTESVALADGFGRVLRADIVAGRDVPSEDNSSMDGYAVRASDVAGSPITLPVVADRPAGTSRDDELAPGQAIRIMTGAAIPRGADSVVPFELTDRGVDRVRIDFPVAAGANIRRAGEDMKRGETVLRGGTILSAGEIGVLATLQYETVPVSRQPEVAILATGSELRGIDQALAAGNVVNSNSHALAVLIRQAGGAPRLLDVVHDDLGSTVAALENAADSDMIVTTGGVSVGAFDYVKEAIGVLGGRIWFWRVSMRPGKPVVVSTIRNRLHFGLPGNPVSCMVGFHLFVAPGIRQALACRDIYPPRLNAVLNSDLRAGGERQTYQRVRLSADQGVLVAHPMPRQGSGVSTSMAGANGLAVMEVGVRSISRGESVSVLLIDAIR